jgi:hypothetical protein
MNWEDIERYGKRAGSILAIVALVGLPVGGAKYLFQLDNRVHNLEAQVQAIVTAPQIGSSSNAQSSGASASAADAIPQACIDLAKRAADLETALKWTESKGLQTLMDKLNCSRIH